MKPFPFGHEKYRQYRNTFLQSVTIGFDFPKPEIGKERLNSQFNDYIQSFFGLSNRYDLTSGESFVSKTDMTHSFAFTDHNAVIQISGKNYVGFSETAIPLIFKLRYFFNKVVETRTITKVGIRKLNVLNLKAKENTTFDASQVRSVLFSNSFVEELNIDNLDDQEKSIPDFMKCEFKEGETNMVIRTALLPPSTSKDDFHHLVLDILGMRQSADGIKVEEMAEQLMDLNSELYHCYHWYISDSVKQVMMQNVVSK